MKVVCQGGRMKTFVQWLRAMPLPRRWAAIGALSAGVTGAIAGLIVGLFVFAPTALFAAAELGLPAALTGAVAGFVAGTITLMVRGIRQRGADSL